MRYLPHTDEDIASMLKVVGADTLDDLFSTIPDDCRRPGDLPSSHARHRRKTSGQDGLMDEIVSINPATLESLGKFPCTPSSKVSESVAAARAAQPSWASSHPARGDATSFSRGTTS